MPIRTGVLAALCLALAVGRVLAQSAPPHALHGSVRDATGGVIVGAGVTLTDADGRSDTAETVLTGSTGEFRFERLAPARYRVVVSAPGFAAATRTVDIGAGPVASIEIVLDVALAERVEVSTAIGGAASAGLTTTTLTGLALDALPDDPAALLRRIREMAGATDTGGQVTVLVDGFRQDVRLPPKHAIQAIRISANWFAPEFAEPGQTRVEIITKPGSSAVHGEIKTSVNDESINARPALAPRRPSGQMRDLSGYLAGPIVPGRWSFVVYGGHWLQRQHSVIHATSVTPDSLEPALFAETIRAPRRVGSLWAGSTYQLSPRHTLAFSVSGTMERAENQGLESGIDLPERAFGRTASSQAFRLTLTSVPGIRVLNELRAQLNPHRSTTQADSAAPAITVLEAFSGGGNQEALFVATRHADAEIANVITVAGPRHTIKAGADARLTRRRYTDRTYFTGAFVFSADVERDAAGMPIAAADGSRTPISPLERYRRTIAGLPGYGPSQFLVTRGEPDVSFEEQAAGAFLQDDWVLSPGVTLSYGVRAEWQSAAARPEIGGRAGLALALDENRRNVIRAGAGSFYQRIEPELTLDVTRLDGHHQQHVLVEAPAFFPHVPAEIESAVRPLPTIYLRAGELRMPQLFITAVSYERQLSRSAFLTVKYGMQRGTHLLRMRNLNVPDEYGGRPTPEAGPVLQYEGSGRLTRHDVTSGVRWTAGRRGTLFANYSYVRGRSDTDGRRTIPADSRRVDLEYGPTAADRPHQANAGVNLNIAGGLLVSPYVTVSSGRRFNITTGFDNDGDGVFADRPALVSPDHPAAIHTSYGSFLADGAAGDLMVPRNFGHEPLAVRVDLRVSKTFRPAGSGAAALVFAANAENVLNRANFEGLNSVVTSPSFGQPKRAATPRRVTLSAGFSF